MRHVLGQFWLQKPPAWPFTGPSSLTALVRTWGQENVLGLNHAFRLSFVYYFPIYLNFPEFFRGLKIRLWIIKSTYKNINQISEFSGNVFDQVSSRVLLVSDKHPRVLTTNPLLSCSERKEWDVCLCTWRSEPDLIGVRRPGDLESRDWWMLNYFVRECRNHFLPRS